MFNSSTKRGFGTRLVVLVIYLTWMIVIVLRAAEESIKIMCTQIIMSTVNSGGASIQIFHLKVAVAALHCKNTVLLVKMLH